MVRIDIVSIFPDYFAPLGLSLPGKAQERGLLDVEVHDLRRWTTDRHRTVDDTPYGGGAGVVMKPEPWGGALDEVAPDGVTLVVPSPAGERFRQPIAAELSTREHLVFACGRYEGIDQRVIDDAATRLDVRELSLGDYVVNGGEVAALAMIEAVVRLLPGFMGNQDSLEEESHTAGLLEYPVYTRPPEWRGHAVPEVLLGGDHALIAEWRARASAARTAQRRPDLLPASSTTDDVVVAAATPGDAGEVWTLLRAARFDVVGCASLEDVRAWMVSSTVVVARASGRLVGVLGIHLDGGASWGERLLLAPDVDARGLVEMLLAGFEEIAAASARRELLVEADRDDLDEVVDGARVVGYRRSGTMPDGRIRLRHRS